MERTPRVKKITSLDLPELQPYRTLRRSVEHKKTGIFVAEGEKVVRRLFSSGIEVISALMTPEWFEKTHPAGAEVYIADMKLLESIVGYNLHQGIMAVGKVPDEIPLDELVPKLPQPHLFVALDGLVNSENVGTIVRNCAAFGVQAVIAGETSSSPYLRRAVRNSMGAVFRMPVVHAPHLAESLAGLERRHRTRVVAADPRGRSVIDDRILDGNICIVLGNEGDGISQAVLDFCSERVAIPMMNDTDSLNVASASAVFLYEARKRLRHSR
jgi:tRNA G18 (ribose-2'-O)-methylase SpoU